MNGKKHGQGVFTMKDQFVYTGEFTDGEITGKGQKIWIDGREYQGMVIISLLCVNSVQVHSATENYMEKEL